MSEAADRSRPRRADWEAAAARALKDRPLAELTWATEDGVVVPPLRAADDGREPVVAARASAADEGRPWDLRALVDHPDPAKANRLLLEELDGGARSALVVLGSDGVGITGPADLARVLDGVLLDLAPVALDAGWAGPAAAEALAALAKGAPRAPLAFHLDPLSAFARDGVSPGPLDGHVAAAAGTAARLAQTYPAASLFLASGRTAHEAGAGEARELGFALAAAVAYLRAADAAGLPPTEVLPRVVLGLSADSEQLTTIAKLRAARVLWARLAAAFDADAPAVIEVRSSGRTLATTDVWTNLLRVTAAGFAAAVGGADAVVLDSFSRPLGAPDAFSRRQARNAQLLMMEESGLGRVDDPAGGSWLLDGLTRDLAAAAWAAFQAIEAEGGLAAALRSGRFAGEVAETAERRVQELAEGRAALIGVTRFPDPDGRAPTVEPRPASAPGWDARLPGADDRCAPLVPLSLAERVQAEGGG